jgi:hypothetical protein
MKRKDEIGREREKEKESAKSKGGTLTQRTAEKN